MACRRSSHFALGTSFPPLRRSSESVPLSFSAISSPRPQITIQSPPLLPCFALFASERSRRRAVIYAAPSVLFRCRARLPPSTWRTPIIKSSRSPRSSDSLSRSSPVRVAGLHCSTLAPLFSLFPPKADLLD